MSITHPTNSVFGAAYSDSYDVLYQEKDYEAECNLIGSIFHTFTSHPVERVLDLGCGTGNHIFPLVRRGYQMTGVDRSEGMLQRAREKAISLMLDGSIKLHEGDVRNVNLGVTFDAVVMMFAVLGYQIENEDVLATLRTVRQHLLPGGLFVFDVWYGPAVLNIRPSQRIKEVIVDEYRYLRVVSTTLNSFEQTCTMDYHLWQFAGNQIKSETQESHVVRYFFPQELKGLLDHAGLELVRLTQFPYLDRQPDENSWNVLGIARAA